MKIGYPCINLSLDCRSSHTFRLKNYSKKRLIETISRNLDCLEKILEFNKSNNILFFRITSDLIPFASHPIMNFDWQNEFRERFKTIGSFIKNYKMRLSMHPGQYTVLNSKSREVYRNSVNDLIYHTEVLDLMELNSTAKVQIHIGGVYGEKTKSLERFMSRYEYLTDSIKKRLIIENDDKNYSLSDCLYLNKLLGIPVVFDVYHDECLKSNSTFKINFENFIKTWKNSDGKPIVHYSSENVDKGKCAHAIHININHFKRFIEKTKNFDFDLMLEIKDKEKSVLEAIKVISNDTRFNE